MNINLHTLFNKRKSIRAFSPEDIENSLIERMIEVAGSSSSAYNEQPWRFIIVSYKNTSAFQKAISCLSEWNASWAKSAPLILIGISKISFSHNGIKNPHAWFDLGQAMALLTVQATAEELFVHPMAGFDVEKTQELFLIPDEFEPVVFAAIGYQGNADILPHNLQKLEKMERIRKPISEIAMDGAWGSIFHP